MLKYALIAALLFPLAAFADDYKLVIKDHRFEPASLTIPAGTKIKLLVENQDDATEEFDSFDLNREKLIPAHSTMPIFIGPLRAGSYKFTGEFHSSTAQGAIIAQ